MKEEKEEELLNSAFRDPIYYILKNNNSNSIVQFVNKNPLSLKTEYSSRNFKEILEKGAQLAEKNGLLFINDTIFS
jgi:hypothetical protein